MQQLSLFDDDSPAIVSNAKQLARAEHPSTSHEAAETILPKLSELHRWAAECVRRMPGHTARELAMEFCPLNERKIGRRLNECEKLGLVRRGGQAKCSVSAVFAYVWFPNQEVRDDDFSRQPEAAIADAGKSNLQIG